MDKQKNRILPGDRVCWSLGGIFDDGKPRVIKHGEVRNVHKWGITAYADGSPREVFDPNGSKNGSKNGSTRGTLQPFFMSVDYADIITEI